MCTKAEHKAKVRAVAELICQEKAKFVQRKRKQAEMEHIELEWVEALRIVEE